MGGAPDTSPAQLSPEATSSRLPKLAQTVEDAERKAIAQALERYATDLGRIADELDVSSTTLWRNM